MVRAQGERLITALVAALSDLRALAATTRSAQRSDDAFTEAADENAASRVMAGIHFRFSTEQGQALGRKVGSYLVKHYLRRR